MNNKKVIFYIGQNDKDTKKQEKSDKEIKSIIENGLHNAKIDGATITAGLVGYWQGQKEKSLQVLCYYITDEQIKTYCEYIKQALNQEAVAVEIINNIQVNFM